jgi:hypothetical protein
MGIDQIGELKHRGRALCACVCAPWPCLEGGFRVGDSQGDILLTGGMNFCRELGVVVRIVQFERLAGFGFDELGWLDVWFLIVAKTYLVVQE